MQPVAGSIIRFRPWHGAVVAVGLQQRLQSFRRIIFARKRRLAKLPTLRRNAGEEPSLKRVFVTPGFRLSTLHWCLAELQLRAYEDCNVVSGGLAHLCELIN